MAIRATLIATGETINLDNGDQVTLDLLEELRGGCPKGIIECREHDGLKHLEHRWDADGRVHGAWLYVKRLQDSTILLCHNPHNDPELKSDSCTLRIGKSDQHRYEQDSLCAIGDRVGFEMNTEHPIRGERGTVVARLDVHGRADGREFGVEVQLSAMGASTAKSRDTKALNAGVPLVWTAKRADAPWAHGNPIAHVATNNLERQVPIDTWRIVSGLRTLVWRPCQEFGRCPTTKTSRNCGARHPLWQADVAEHEEHPTVASFLERYGDGRIVRLDTRTKQGVFPVEARMAQQWEESYPPALPAPRSAPGERSRGGRNSCSYSRVDELPLPVKVKRKGSLPVWAAPPKGWAGPRDTPEGAAALIGWRPGEAPRHTCPACGDPSVERVHPTCDTDDPDWYLEQRERPRSAEPCTGNPGLCGACRGGPCSSGQVDDGHDPLLDLPHTMRANWWSVCPSCGWRINERAVIGLRDLGAGGRGRVCAACLSAAEVPAPRQGETSAVTT